MLYTRKGDDGTTKFFDSKPRERAKKNSLRAEALGACDEVGSLLGLCKVKSEKKRLVIKSRKWHVRNILEFAQQGIFIVQAELAGAEKHFPEEKVEFIEAAIDAMEREMPPIKSFFVSGGTELGALFDFARTVARRAERRVVAAVDAPVHEPAFLPPLCLRALREFPRGHQGKAADVRIELSELNSNKKSAACGVAALCVFCRVRIRRDRFRSPSICLCRLFRKNTRLP